MGSQEQKSLVRLVIAGSTLVLFLAFSYRSGHAEWVFGLMVFAIMLVSALGLGSDGQIQADERDRALRLKAVAAGTFAFWVVASAGLWGSYAWLSRSSSTIPVDAIAMIAWLGWVTFECCQAAAVLVVYRLNG